MAMKQTIFFRYLDTVGDGSGTKDASANFGTPDYYFIKPPAATHYVVERLTITIQDTTATTALADRFGTSAAITNGLQILYTKGTPGGGTTSIITDITDGVNIKKNSDILRLSSVANTGSFTGAAEGAFVGEVDFTRATGGALVLDGDNGEALAVYMSDNLSAMAKIYYIAQGYSFAVGD